jgi:hypothetical protein
MPLIAVT